MYIVIELQTYDNGTVGNIVNKYDTLNEAESKWHSVLAAAAVSTLPVHAAVILTNAGTLIRSEYFMHGGEA